MKAQYLTLAALSAMILASCGGTGSGNGDAMTDSTATDSINKEITYVIDSNSTISWSGTMLGVKTHTGTMRLASGHFTTKGGALTGGEFTVNMKGNYVMNDTNYTPDGSKQGTKAMLMGHLMSGDFFAADTFPTSTFKITKVSGNTATGELTVRGKTNEETVTDIVINEGNGGVTAVGKLTFNRQKYGVTWSSGSKDYVLSDDVLLQVDLMGKAQ